MPRFLPASPFLVTLCFLATAAAESAEGGIGVEPVRSATATPEVVRQVEGWTVRVHPELMEKDPAAVEKALGLLGRQLAEIVRVVPAGAVAKLREVTLWFSPPHPGAGQKAEYHPGAEWLRSQRRNPLMAKGVEFTNIAIFEQETRRMPNFALHELAHSFHDRVLGFGQPDILEAYRRAKESGTYEKVQRWNGDGKPTVTARHYALTNEKEYFAEATEAFFARNDFYPFDRKELKEHDPVIFSVLEKVWNSVPAPAETYVVTAPPASLKLDPFYHKFISAKGFPIVASERVNDYALKEAAYLVNLMLVKRPDIRSALIEGGTRMCLLAHNEFTTDLPDFASFRPKDFWDARARGTGGSETDPCCSAAEENLLGYPGDPYSTECILIHEFAHAVHLRGVNRLDPTFDGRLRAAYEAAMAQGLWKGKYAATNHAEYFAEGVQSWFDNNRPPDHDHNHVHTRVQLKEYDPGLAALCQEVFRDTELVYTYPKTRLHGHLEGYDPTQAPSFAWPERLKEARSAQRAKIQEKQNAEAGREAK